MTAKNGVVRTTIAAFAVRPDSRAPSVSITNLTNGAQVGPGRAVKVAASDGGAGVARTQVRFCHGTSCVFAKGTAIGTDATAPYALTWSNLPANGTYTLIAQAIDRVGNRQWSAPVTVKVVTSQPRPRHGRVRRRRRRAATQAPQ